MTDSIGSSVELSPDECLRGLASQSVGRVAFVTPEGPRIVPVNFVVRDGQVEFRTTSYSELATYAPGSAVAFEVDDHDATSRSGWSVVVTGECRRDADAFGSVLSESGGSPATPWAGGRRPLVLRLATDQLSGRRVGQEWHHPETGSDDRH